MSILYIAGTASLYEEKQFKKYCECVDQTRLTQVLRTGTRDGQVRSLVAGILIQQGLRDQIPAASGFLGSKREKIKTTPIEISYTYGTEGKPYLAEASQKYYEQNTEIRKPFPMPWFSISHSGSYVLCGFAEQEIGVDIQEHTCCNLKVADRFFTKVECALLQDCKTEKERQRLFFQMWTVKESYIKLTGEGMKQGLNTFHIDWKERCIRDHAGEQMAYFEQRSYAERYSMAVCTRHRQEEAVLRTVQL